MQPQVRRTAEFIAADVGSSNGESKNGANKPVHKWGTICGE